MATRAPQRHVHERYHQPNASERYRESVKAIDVVERKKATQLTLLQLDEIGLRVWQFQTASREWIWPFWARESTVWDHLSETVLATHSSMDRDLGIEGRIDSRRNRRKLFRSRRTNHRRCSTSSTTSYRNVPSRWSTRQWAQDLGSSENFKRSRFRRSSTQSERKGSCNLRNASLLSISYLTRGRLTEMFLWTGKVRGRNERIDGSFFSFPFSLFTFYWGFFIYDDLGE